MSDSTSPQRMILLHEDGSARSVLGEVSPEAREADGRYRVLVDSDRLLLLHRETEPRDSSPRTRVVMAGEILHLNSVLEIVNMVVASRWSGTLHIHGPDSHRQLGIEKGALRHASSDDPEDRLNKVLFRRGVISVSQSESVERMPREDQRFGRGLVEKGIVPEAELFRHLQEQMREIFFSALFEDEGVYAFLLEGGPRSAPPMIAYRPLQQMLFDGAERLDHMKEYRKLVSDDGMCPMVQPGVEVTRMEPKVRRVFGFCDGTRTVRDIATETWLGRYETLAVLYELARRGWVRFQPAPKNPTQVARHLVEPYNRALDEIGEFAGRTGDRERTVDEVSAWIGAGDLRDLLDGVLVPPGRLDVDRVARVLDDLKIRDRAEVVGEALEQLISYALFVTCQPLSRDAERELTRRVRDELQKKAG